MTQPSQGRTRRVEQVLGLAACGMHVFPLRPDDKRPAITDWEQRATNDPGRITRAWTGPYARSGVGIACGPSRLVVVDLDTAKGDTPPAVWALPGIADGADVLAELHARHGARWPFGVTPAVRTASGGLHLYYRAPASRPVRNSASKVGWKVDVRAAGGYVVAPPSTAVGKPYEWLTGPHGAGPVELPLWLADLAAPPAPPRPVMPATVRSATGYTAAALRGEVQHVLDAHPGTRNDSLHRAAFNLGTLAGAGRLDRAVVVDALLDAAQGIGLGATESEKTIISGLAAGMQHPRGAAA